MEYHLLKCYRNSWINKILKIGVVKKYILICLSL